MSAISLENRLAVYELIARYAHEVDNYRGEGWADLFLEDGRLISPGAPHIGRQALINQAKSLQDRGMKYRHVITNIYLSDNATDEHAVANAYGTVTEWSRVPAEVGIFADYRFEMVNRDGQWKFVQVTVSMPYNGDMFNN